MNFLQKIKLKLILFHSLFWVAVWFFFFYFFSYNSDKLDYALWFSSGLLPLTIAITYFVNFRLIPKYLLAKRYWKFALYSFYTLIYCSYIITLLIYTCLIFVLKFDVDEMPLMSKNFFFILLLIFLVVGIISFVSVLNQSFKTATANRELQNKILSTQLQMKEQELHYLKRQIHPHFLFNTLNTIYGFALKQSKHTPDIILKLSNLLDYILYQVNKPKVSLKEEVLHIEEYIALEKIRFQDTMKIIFETSEIDEKYQIAPMLLIPFVENAFKHGAIINGFLQIEIKIVVEKKRLSFFIKNTIQNETENSDKSGIGLQNIKKRLELNYPNNYSLENKINKEWYSAKLEVYNINDLQNV